MPFQLTDYEQLNEERLLCLAKSGDKSAEHELIQRLYLVVYYEAIKFDFPGIEKADLIQEGMIAVFHAMHTYIETNGSKFKTYTRTCVYNHFNSLARKFYQKKHIPHDKMTSLNKIFIQADASNPEQLVIEKERVEEIHQSLKSKLSDFEYEVFKKYLGGYSVAEIAETLSIDVKQVSNALYRIRQKFHFILK